MNLDPVSYEHSLRIRSYQPQAFEISHSALNLFTAMAEHFSLDLIKSLISEEILQNRKSKNVNSDLESETMIMIKVLQRTINI